MSDPLFWVAVDDLFTQTVALAPAERFGRLALFNGPSGVRREVESLLIAHDADGAELELAEAEPSAVSLIGRRLGPWAVVREVGRGGMGAVYEASRDDAQYRKRVAIKTIGRSLDSEAIARRFRQEQQILASLEHPNIATLIDGGVSPDGVPYFVMEFVDGLPITRYCTEHRLSLKERLDLFRQVCAAVEFAHRNLVVHRDIKPSNVYVTGDGTVKLLDFGIAKLLRDAGEGAATLTETGYRAFTTAYASPEQVRGEPISTATDIYSLGTLFYLLLTGRLPLDVEKLAPAEAMARICDTNPAPPSAAATDEAAAAAGLRDREQLARALRGELDAIVLSALRKEPERRYSTVAAFSDDVKRFLQGQQVMARPDTWRYRVRTFTRRNRGLVYAFGLAALFLVAGAVAAGWQAHVAGRERDRARSEAARSTRVVAFVEQLLATPTPGGLTGTAATIMENALRQANTELADDPLARAAVNRTAARAYVTAYQFDRAMALLDTALSLDREHAGPGSNEVGRDLAMLGEVSRGKGDFPLAVARGHDAVAVLRQHPGSKPEDLSRALSELGKSLMYTGRPREAIPFLEEAVARQSAQLPSPLLPAFIYLLGYSQELIGKPVPAESAYRRALQLFDSLPEPDPVDRGGVEFGLADLLLRKGSLDEAEAMAQKALQTLTRWLGPDNVTVGHVHGSLAILASHRGQRPRALAEIEEAVRIMQGRSVSVLERTRIEIQRGRVLDALDRWREAGAIWERVLSDRRVAEATEPLMIAEAADLAGQARLHRREYAAAEPLYLEAHALYAKALGPGHNVTKGVASWLVFLYTAWGKEAKAAPFLEGLSPEILAAVRNRSRAFGKGGPWRARR